MVHLKKFKYVAEKYQWCGIPERHCPWFLRNWRQRWTEAGRNGIRLLDIWPSQDAISYCFSFLDGIWKKLIGANMAIVKADRNFGVLARNLLKEPKESVNRCFGTIKTEKLQSFKAVYASIKLDQEVKPAFCAARKIPKKIERKVDRTIVELLSFAKLVPVKTGGVNNCSPVLYVTKSVKLRANADYKLYVNDKGNNKAHTLPCIETICFEIIWCQWFCKKWFFKCLVAFAMDENAQQVRTLDTTQGPFRNTRLQQRLKKTAANS